MLRNLSAAAFYVLLGLLGLGAWKVKRDTEQTMERLRLELDAEALEADPGSWDPERWGWIVDVEEDGSGIPMYVPDDMAEQAIAILDDETVDELRAVQDEQVKWLIDPMAMRYAMYVAQQEPNLELALFTWIANNGATEG